MDENMEKKLEEKATRAFKWLLKYRKVKLKDLAEDLNVNLTTLYAYSSGKMSIRNGRAGLIFEIAEYLRADPRFLVGIGNVDFSRGTEYLYSITLEEAFEDEGEGFILVL